MNNNTSVNCKKCRINLLPTSEYELLNVHGFPLLDSTSDQESECQSLADKSMLYLSEETLPEFIIEAVSQSNWTKGKITCPKCTARIGSFNFISGLKCDCGVRPVPPVHLLHCKIDYFDQSLRNTLPKPSLPVLTSDIPPQCSAPSISVPSTEGVQSDTDMEGLPSVSEDTVTSDLSADKHTQECRKDEEYENSEIYKDDSTLPQHLICAVCLDLYYNPFSVEPCGHVFCETCLRRLAQPCPHHTACPMCREIIGQCHPKAEYAKEIKKKYMKLYEERRKFEHQQLRAQIVPLPYQRTFRHLIERHRRPTYTQARSGWRTIFFVLIIQIFGLAIVLFLKLIFGHPNRSIPVPKKPIHESSTFVSNIHTESRPRYNAFGLDYFINMSSWIE